MPASRASAFSRQVLAWLLRRWWLGLFLVAVGIVGIICTANYGSYTRRLPSPVVIGGNTTTSESVGYGWQLPAIVGSFVFLIAGAAIILQGTAQRTRPITRPERIAKLTAALNEALGVISEINREVEDGYRVLAQLERETETHRQLAKLSSEEAAAVLDELRSTVRGETTRGTWLSVVVAAVFFGLGVLITMLIH